MRKLFNDENGFIVSAELVLVLTIGVLGMVVGLASFRDAIVTEFCDLGSAFGALDQSYNYNGVHKVANGGKGHHGSVKGSGYNDSADDCDCKSTTYSSVCGKDDSSASGLSETSGGAGY